MQKQNQNLLQPHAVTGSDQGSVEEGPRQGLAPKDMTALQY